MRTPRRLVPLVVGTAIGAAALALVPGLRAQDGGASGGGAGDPNAGEWTSRRVAKTWNHTCTACHTVPDTKFATDLAWLDQVNRTSWTATAPEARAVLIRWLKENRLPRPEVVAESAAPTTDGGAVLPGFAGAGEVFLTQGRRTLRATWPATPAGAEPEAASARARPVPAGEWKVRGYRIERTAADGAKWIVSIASKGYRSITIEPGKTLDLAIEPALTVRARARGPKGRLQLGTGFSGQGGCTGVTLYRDGRRIAVGYRLVDDAGNTVAEGPMAYG